MVNISTVLQKGEIVNAVEICVHQKLKEWEIINILFYKDVLWAGAKPGFGDLEAEPALEPAARSKVFRLETLQAQSLSNHFPQHETLADLQCNLL